MRGGQVKHEHWELVIDGKLADRFHAWDIDADIQAKQLSEAAPLLTVHLYEGWYWERKPVSMWRKGKRVKA
jgi:hypothetical protein